MDDARILVTHTGSLPRPKALTEALVARDRGQFAGEAASALRVQAAEAVRALVERQVATGIDVLGDGEASKMGYATYVKERLTGFDGEGDGSGLAIADLSDVPDLAARALRGLDIATPACTGPVAYRGHTAVEEDIANLRVALAGRQQEAFLCAASPGVISIFLQNMHYPNEDEYLLALCDAMREEYLAIHAAGFMLQIDSPDLAMGRHVGTRLLELGEFRTRVAQRVDMLNHAVRGIPPERLRVHLCWGNYEGPHHHDVELATILDHVFRLNARYILFEAANPRHAHEWRIFDTIKVPDDKVLVPGVIDTSTNYVEHPDAVADRIERYARLVGPGQVMAGTDCGFATFATFMPVEPQIAWMKLKALADGAAIASRRLR